MVATNRLESMIRRLTAQRNCLALAIELIAEMPGPVLEFGLGKGRTYDFLRNRLPDRCIFAFDRDIHCPPDCLPAPDRLFLGDFRVTLPEALGRIGTPAALAHFDVGSEDLAADARLVAWLAPAAAPLLRPGAVVVSDRAMAVPVWRAQSLAPGTGDGNHFVYRVEG